MPEVWDTLKYLNLPDSPVWTPGAQTRIGPATPPQRGAPVQDKESSHQAGPRNIPWGTASCGRQGTVFPLTGNRWQQILIAFIIIIFLCMCAQEIYRQLWRQNQLFML